MKVLSVVSEVYPLIKTGGLADVAGALPAALSAEGVEVATLVPGYPAVMNAIENVAPIYWMDELFGGPATVLSAEAAGLQLFVIEAKHLYDRPGGPYVSPAGVDWADNAFRYAALARVAAQIAYGEVAGFVPDVVHAHDWQAGLVPAFLRYDGRRHAPSVITVHNLAFQGQFPASIRPALGLPAHAFSLDGVEYYGMIGYLKAGLAIADRITTVSPTYASEIRSVEGGMGLSGLLTARGSDLVGILNGIDDEVWNPQTDPSLPQRFALNSRVKRTANKAELQRRLGLEEAPDRLLYGVVSRLSWQKGIDLLAQALPHLIASGAQLALVGSGDDAIQQAFTLAASAHPGSVGTFYGYDENLAHLVQAGVDSLIVPSRFEPCGLTQLCALRYGALPLVARVGGLADTIIDANEMARQAGIGTGVQFAPVTQRALETGLDRMAEIWRDQTTWNQLQKNAMKTDVSWRGPAKHYAALYREIAGLRAGG
ncbi:MAG: glycogen synthase GlgA [Ancalomicrobiaceae bacterium]|nr:glycogen synthase GlgA [Ancalomicrobiaceae bacterium]